ncbi:MAG: hypothetical protein FJX54_03690 [Alphaproteobacteria bacterium]|nr:hypothetical protein [Alphaproteobacteria bacterium]
MAASLRRAVAIAAVLLFCVSTRPALAEEEPLSVWTYSLYKTITYETMANLADIPLYAWVVGGAGVAATGVFTAVNVTTAAAAYFAHETIWNVYFPPESADEVLEVGVGKVLIYRVVSTVRNLALAYAFGATASANLAFAMASNVVDATLHAANEYGWYAYGPPVASLGFVSSTTAPARP